MSKVAHIQRPLIGPWLDWNQLPDSVREQALDVLTASISKSSTVPGSANRSAIIPQAPRALDPSALAKHGVRKR